MKRILAIAVLLGALVTGTTSFAQTRTPVVTHRQARQQRRIEQGVRSGRLTPHETARLERREGKIQMDKRRAKADGKVTMRERRHLRREENRTSRAIYRKKHN